MRVVVNEIARLKLLQTLILDGICVCRISWAEWRQERVVTGGTGAGRKE